jgi:hypothetical protein
MFEFISLSLNLHVSQGNIVLLADLFNNILIFYRISKIITSDNKKELCFDNL